MSITSRYLTDYLTVQDDIIRVINESKALREPITSTDSDEFCHCDAISPSYRVEIKDRSGGPHNPDTLLEKYKWDKNNLDGTDFIYAVKSDGKLWLFNPTQMVRDGYEFEWETRWCPETTAFKKNNYVPKKVAMVDWSEAFWFKEI